MNVSDKQNLTKTEQSVPLHTGISEIHTKDSKNSIPDLAKKALTEASHVANKPQHEWGEVFVLVGTSTAGKSSIIYELIKQNPEMVERGVDLAYVSIPFAYLNKHHPKEMAYLESMIEPTKDEIGNTSYLVNYV
ncbi:MAG TPA: hypothetical protein VGP47_08370, partial [Parachlamydiaceae bacterium]|nr:hypothetical protein [Parachlamydiaceae bacterium]